MREITIKKGRFKGNKFKIDSTVDVDDSLAFLASQGNWAAKNAIDIDNYKQEDAPFVYGKIGGLGFIISKKDL